MDTTRVHGCYCITCGSWQRDNEDDVNHDGICWECVETQEMEDGE